MTGSELKERLTDTIALLSIPGIGRGRFRKLVERFGTPAGVLAASRSELESVSGLSHTIAGAVREGYDGEKARQAASRIMQLGWSVLFPKEEGYPPLLSELVDRPAVLFRSGDDRQPVEKVVAIVGTRHATEKGRRFASHLAGELARAGIPVVSGMAEGIDAAAHRGALDAGGRTIAVWGTSLDIVYPPSNGSLAREILQSGAIYSEYLPGTRPEKTAFPERNRIISGISEAVVVVEAGARSGALITARCAIDQNRELFAVPGAPDAANAEGTNALIKKGANLLTRVFDIFDHLPRLKGEVAVKRFQALPDMTETERRMVGFLSDCPVQIDQLSRAADLAVPELMGFLLALEVKGVVRELSGKRFVLTE
ncbi:MAG TPA: DNA-processing protein DprA [Acidobacteriota bacterium]|nr:DNA-processing protein DprA [Acidobacteriota bacterium]